MLRNVMQSNFNRVVDGLPKNWTPPPNQHFRLNADAAFNEQLNTYGVAELVRNHDGHMLFAFGKRILQPGSMVYTKLLVIQERIKLVCEKDLI